MNNLLWITGGRIIDPENGRDGIGEIFAKDGKIVAELSSEEKEKAHHYDAEGYVVCPGLVDIHVHLRDPGQTHKESIESGTRTAAVGGVTTVICMPNTAPAADSPATIRQILESVKRDALVNVYTTGTLTIGRKGQELAPIGALKEAGVMAITDDGDCIQSAETMRRVCEYAAMFDLPVMDHCQDASLTQGASMNEGEVSLKLGLKGWPNAAEDLIVARNIIISKYTGAHIHMQHVTSGYSVELLRDAKKKGIRVSAEVTPHHLAITEEGIGEYDTNFKMNPPLRTESDRQALIEGLLDGTIDCIATDHAPHTEEEKAVEFDKAPFGIIGLETLLPISLEVLVDSGKSDLNFVIDRLTKVPSKLMHLNKGTLSVGADADITVFDPEEKWIYTPEVIESCSSNSPWVNRELKGKVKATFVGGRCVYRKNKIVKLVRQ